jgi:hypothetical protein
MNMSIEVLPQILIAEDYAGDTKLTVGDGKSGVAKSAGCWSVCAIRRMLWSPNMPNRDWNESRNEPAGKKH